LLNIQTYIEKLTLKVIIKTNDCRNFIVIFPGFEVCRYFLLLARYVPNVAKRSIWDQCK